MAARRFANRAAAGIALGRELTTRSFQRPVVVLGLARGGVPVAYEVARRLHAPLDVMLVRKIGMPGQPELAIGAIAMGNVVVHDPRFPTSIRSLTQIFDQVVSAERRELARRECVYRAGLGRLDLHDKTAVLVDDGLATGCTMLAAIRAARQVGAAEVVAAAPIASEEAEQLVATEADAVAILGIPPELSSIGEWYQHFEQLEDEEVCRLLALDRENRRHASSAEGTRREGA
jgi:putative phosphoribosyl transferase